MEQRNEIIFTLKCPKCSQELPQALKRAELLETMEVNCPNEAACGWKGLAKNATVKQQSIEEWYGPSYQQGAPGFYSREEMEKVFEQDIKDGKINMDEIFKWKK